MVILAAPNREAVREVHPCHRLRCCGFAERRRLRGAFDLRDRCRYTESAGQPADPATFLDAAGTTAAFASPSGNIQCSLYRNLGSVGDTAICQISRHKYTFPPKPPDCQGVYGQTADVSIGKGANVECSGDPVRQTAVILAYGQSLTLGAAACRSTKSGVRCESSPGHGFIISQSELVLFN